MRTVIAVLLAVLVAFLAIAGEGCSTEVIELAPDGGQTDLTTRPHDLAMPPPTDLTS